ncbi:Fungalysin metallopeptidase-domain-containing protein [Collybia nuda]|uniref:Extracellular metalloproteinase n=1 Tax=Collybia nuda TaxID=64659 RepID=A0A9P5Y052_9AGAR|nr:Fungalysin metallopeptidase-domain-containing protein [Collybia nuda]
MLPFSRLFAATFLAIVYASVSRAAPHENNVNHATHRIRTVGSRGLQLETFHPASTYQTFGEGIDHPLRKRDGTTLQDSAVTFVQSHLNLTSSEITFKSGFEGQVARHAYVKQSANGIPFANAVANVAFNKDGKVVAFGSSFVKPKTIASPTPSITLNAAIAKAEDVLDGTYNGHPSSIQYLAKSDGSAALTHAIQIQNEETGTWFDAFVDAHSGELLHVTDFVSKASYLVLPITKQNLTQGFETLTNPYDAISSPNGWHSTGTVNFTCVVSGNNAVAFKGTNSSLTAQSSSPLNFLYTQNPATQPTAGSNVDAARTNAFYIVNTLHDVTYRYGFTEAAYNFQSNNFGKGGKGGDPVTVSVQSSAGLDNADFATPPDGQSGLMRMFLWDYTSPERDGALENDIVTHENTHGLTNRMTGGGTGACLQTLESGGLGEGWSDAMADWIEKTSSAVPDFVLGTYVINFSTGVRGYPYSTNPKINPLKYSSLLTYREVHVIGEIWANMLHNVYAALVEASGWSSTARTNPDGKEGNVMFLHLMIDALALQPCNPTFLDARDAWIQADVNRYQGANKCVLWKAFASRGMGMNAASYGDSAAVPSGC